MKPRTILMKILMIKIIREQSRILHDAGWENSYFTSSDVSMLVHGCGVSQYPQF